MTSEEQLAIIQNEREQRIEDRRLAGLYKKLKDKCTSIHLYGEDIEEHVQIKESPERLDEAIGKL